MEMATKKVKTEEVKMQTGGLCYELVEDILHRVSVKQLAKMKCLSKSWPRFISNYRQRPRSSTTTLLCQYSTIDDEERKVVLLDTEEHGGELNCLEHVPHNLFEKLSNTYLGSSNGLLLSYKTHPNISFEEFTFYVSIPTLDQMVSLSPVCYRNQDAFSTGLPFDGIPHHGFKVVCFNFYSFAQYVNYQIFSSDTRTWESKRAKLLNPGDCSEWKLAVNYFTNAYNKYPAFVYYKGMLHWLYRCYMLVFHLKKNVFELIVLPTDGRRGILWESEDECLHFCNIDDRNICIWEYVNGSLDKDHTADLKYEPNTLQRWKMKHEIDIVTLLARHPKILGSMIEEQFLDYIKICAFDEHLQIVYLQVPGAIICCSFETQRLQVLWRTAGGGADIVSFSSRLSGVKLQLGDECKGL